MKSMNNGERIAESNEQMKWEDKQPDLRALIYKLRLMRARDEKRVRAYWRIQSPVSHFKPKGRAGCTHTS